jgi:hypothetical protein
MQQNIHIPSSAGTQVERGTVSVQQDLLVCERKGFSGLQRISLRLDLSHFEKSYIGSQILTVFGGV